MVVENLVKMKISMVVNRVELMANLHVDSNCYTILGVLEVGCALVYVA